ncbi:FAD:protein FMN transferase [Arthrobacter sp. FW305-BF8]|uniref:FAD:protein FMN transferase n=1 Tax=Arthrobacter sp. FW305-BF8 TaxID=2879617 RepID=UPI001F2E16FE|nr:FAD:protein FMN transferase [Arthrobacter sp. FW305-BF8]UKA52891.1 FAD:protein FMN transferase [Arthrobacter sp. FW305-BF8]
MPHPGWQSFRFDGIGTSWEISTPAPLPPGLRSLVLAEVERYDFTWSRFREDSLVTRIAAAPGQFELPPEAAGLAALYRQLYTLSGGGMTPLIGESLERLGYDPRYSLQPRGEAAPPPAWDAVMEWHGTSLRTTAPVVLDIGAAGKGQLVDLLAEQLRGHGVPDFFIDASGDLLNGSNENGSQEPVQVALEHPYDAAKAIGTVPLGSGALCASASNRRAWGDGLHHVLDGTTGAPVRTVVATWARADTAMEADALATALFLVPAEDLERHFRFSWLKVFSNGSAEYSAEFEGRLFT